MGLDYLQMMVFPFYWNVVQLWNGSVTLYNYSNWFCNFNISTLLPGVNFNSFLVAIYLSNFFVVLIVVDIVYVSYSFTKKKFKVTWPLLVLSTVVPICVTVLSQPIMETLLGIVNCQVSSYNPNIQTMQNYPQIVCWQGMHLVHATITLFITGVFVFIAAIVALTLF